MGVIVMKGTVVYQSKFGSSRQVAEAIVKGLEDAGLEVELVRVADAGNLDPGIDLLVIGGPTRIGRAYGPIKRLAKRKFKEGWAGKLFATFSTGASIGTEKESPQASDVLQELLKENGLEPIAPPFKAGVDDMHGPLREGEVERAEQYGRELGSKLSGDAAG